MHPDFLDMLSALRVAGAEYLVVGAHALAAHGHPRATGDLDIWVRATAQNAHRVYEALRAFGAPLDAITKDDLSTPELVLQIGVQPVRVDILTSVSGLTFENAWPGRLVVTVEGQEIPVLGRADLIRNKQATGRPRDLADLTDLGA